MATITEDYVSFEIAKLLKEKGFNEKCRGGYHSEFDDNDNSIVMLEEWMAQPYNNDFEDETFLCSAPTHQMAMAWLRDIYYLWIDIEPLTNHKWTWGIWFMNDPKLKMGESSQVISTYEEAVEASLKYTLENLI